MNEVEVEVEFDPQYVKKLTNGDRKKRNEEQASDRREGSTCDSIGWDRPRDRDDGRAVLKEKEK
jgi:hypothetical protein